MQTIKEGRTAAALKAPGTALEDTPMKRGKPIAGVIVKALKDTLKQMICKNPATTLSNKTEKRTENFYYFEILETNGEAIAEEAFNGLWYRYTGNYDGGAVSSVW